MSGFIKNDRVKVQMPNTGLVWEGKFVIWLGPVWNSKDGSWYADILIDGNDGSSRVNERCFRRSQES